MKTISYGIGALSLIIAGVAAADGGNWSEDQGALIVTASNTASNQLLIYNPAGTLLKQIPTQGQGGVSGNAGCIAQNRDRLAVVNFGSGNVSIFAKETEHRDLRLEHLIQAIASPVSVAFGHGHLYILTTTHVESHRVDNGGVSASADGSAALVVADGSAAQVGTLPDQLIISEKSNVIETVNLDSRGAVAGAGAGWKTAAG